MKAFLLAGGLGERLRPLTRSMPKCLVPIDGVPLLAYWLDLCAREGITDVLLNVSQHPDQVRALLDGHREGPRVTLVVEDVPSGTAGIVRDERAFVAGEESFWIFYADNLTDVGLVAMRERHRRHDGLATVGLFRAPTPSAAGIVDLDGEGRIVRFTEKPTHPQSDLANAGLYLARQGLIDCIPAGPRLVDFAHDVFPSLAGRLYGWPLEGFLMDIGTPDALSGASAAWSRRRATEAPR